MKIFDVKDLLQNNRGMVVVLITKLCLTLATPWTIACSSIHGSLQEKNTEVDCHFGRG